MSQKFEIHLYGFLIVIIFIIWQSIVFFRWIETTKGTGKNAAHVQ